MGMSGGKLGLRAFGWIGAVSQTAQMQALIDLDRAWTNFSRGAPDVRGRASAAPATRSASPAARSRSGG